LASDAAARTIVAGVPGVTNDIDDAICHSCDGIRCGMVRIGNLRRFAGIRVTHNDRKITITLTGSHATSLKPMVASDRYNIIGVSSDGAHRRFV